MKEALQLFPHFGVHLMLTLAAIEPRSEKLFRRIEVFTA